MSNGRGEVEIGRPRRAFALVGALFTVALMILLPSGVLLLTTSPSGHTAPPGSSSRLSAFWDKPVHFIETGLLPGTTWSVKLSGTVGSSNTTEINFTWIVGKFRFSVFPVPDYTASPSSGNVTVTETGATVYITFTPLAAQYSVTFNESGLAPGTLWWVNMSGTNLSSTSGKIIFSVVNGSYPFTTPSTIPGTSGERFVTALTSGTADVHGSNLTIDVPYVTQFFLSMGVRPTGAGTVTPSSGWIPAGVVVNLTEAPAVGFAFAAWNGSGDGNYSGINPTPAITMRGPIDENATFGVAYAVDFEEVGLPDGVTWAVTFNGVTHSGFFVFLDFAAANGTYPYNVTPLPGFHADVYRGTVTVAGNDVTVTIHWVRVTYNVSFVETGLANGVGWSVTLNGTTESVVASTILFVESNGSLPFTIGSVPGYTANVTSGTVVVNGANVTIDIGFTASSVARGYTVTFVETGLPFRNSWSVALKVSFNDSVTSMSTSLAFTGIASGSYHYWVPDSGTYKATSPSGIVTVAGTNVTVALEFAGLGPAVSPASGLQISAEDLVIFALIGCAGIIAAYLVYRRE